MIVYAHVLGEAPVRLWGLSSQERLQRVLQRVGVTDVVEDLGSVSADSSVLLFRGDYLFDNRVVNTLAKSPNVVLQVPSETTHVLVAAHVPAKLAAHARDVLRGSTTLDGLPGVNIETPQTLSSSFDESLLKSELPYVEPIQPEQKRMLEERLFAGSYKGVTDLVTKWVWPVPAQWVTRLCVCLRIKPNHVTGLSLVLVLIAGVLFAYGLYGWGLLAGWLMTFLDTVDGKLARVTVTSSQFGNALDKGLDLIHPPLWYIVWGLGLKTFHPNMPGFALAPVFWLIVIGYIGGRLVEGAFLLWLGKFGIFCWRPLDSYFRLITSRRNPNLVLLTLSLVVGRPDVGLMAVTLWTVLSTFLLLVRLIQALYVRNVSGPLRSWLADIDKEMSPQPLAVRLFAHQRSVGKS